MKKNMGNADRIIRLLLAVVLIYLYSSDTVTGLTGIILFILGAVFIVTSIFGYCPLYSLLGIKRCHTDKHSVSKIK